MPSSCAVTSTRRTNAERGDQNRLMRPGQGVSDVDGGVIGVISLLHEYGVLDHAAPPGGVRANQGGNLVGTAGGRHEAELVEVLAQPPGSTVYDAAPR